MQNIISISHKLIKMSQTNNERQQLVRSESIFQRHDLKFDFDFDYSSEEEEDNDDNRSDSSEILACQESEASDQQNIFRQEKISKYGDYQQVTQIVVEFIKSSWTHTGFGVICVERSAEANEIYIYIPLTGNVYTIKNDHTLSAQYLIDYILYTTPEFVDYVKGKEVDFVLEGYAMPDNMGYCETPDETETKRFLRLPLDEVPLSQATLRLRSQ